jgi:hypothetical protein
MRVRRNCSKPTGNVLASLASGSDDRTVRLRDVATCHQIGKALSSYAGTTY